MFSKTAWSVLLALVLSSAAAHAQGMLEDYRKTYLTFRSGLPFQDSFAKTYAVVLDGIDGKWGELTAYFDGPDATEDGVAKVCSSIYFKAARTHEFSFSLTRWSTEKDAPLLTYGYTTIGGNAFVQNADPQETLKAFALDPPEATIQMKMNILNSSNKIVEIFRPSPDLIVVKGLLEQALIYGRCP